jgi:predicted nucleic acid-binding protein
VNQVFADSSFWIALLYKADRKHSAAQKLLTELKGKRLVTSDFVCLEVLNHAAGERRDFREQAGAWAATIKLTFGFRVIRESLAHHRSCLRKPLAFIAKEVIKIGALSIAALSS